MRDYSTSMEPRVLFVLPDLSTPPIRGYEVRAVNLARELTNRFAVELMTPDGQRPRPQLPHRILTDLSGAARTVGRNWPLQTVLFDGPKVAAHAVRLAAEWKPQVVVAVTERLPYTSIALAKRFPVILDVVDSMALHMAERSCHGPRAIRWFWKLEADRFARLAGTLGEVVKVVVAASETAKEHYPRAIVIPNASSLASRPRPAPRYDLVFTGNLWYWPNVNAVRIVCEEVVPLIRRRLPGVRVLIAGRDPTARVRRLCQKANITLMANVPDMGDILASSRIAIAPIEWTPGANLKILDALAVGTPVIAFRAAAGQLPDRADGVLTCDSAQEMAISAVQLLIGDGNSVRTPAVPTWAARADTLALLIDQLREQTLLSESETSPIK
jgi:glycosyl transferase family 1